jgi:serine/threonine protein kinase
MTSAGTTGFREMTFEGAPRFVELVELRWLMDCRSQTYAAFDRKRGEQVWIKEASRDKDARPEVIAQEYALFRQLALTVGPHVPSVHELFEGDGGIAYSREPEPLHSVNLTSYFYDHVKDEARIRRTFHGLVAALDGLHGLGFVHCDILPGDVLVTPEGRAVLMSLDAATEAGGRPPQPIGNPRYMASDKILGQPATPAQDFYAVGVALFEALTGQSPPFGATLQAVMQHKISGPAPAPSSVAAGVPEDLDRLCTAMLDPDPARRPAAREVLQVLDDRRRSIGGEVSLALQDAEDETPPATERC